MKKLRPIHPIELAVGTDGTFDIPLYDDDGADLDVTGLSATWRLFRAVPRRWNKPFVGTIRSTKDTDGDVALATGLATVTYNDADFAGLAGRFWHVIRVTDGDGAIVEYGEGPLLLRGWL